MPMLGAKGVFECKWSIMTGFFLHQTVRQFENAYPFDLSPENEILRRSPS